MSTLSFTYSDRTVQDVVQLHAYLASTIGTSFKYVNYIPSAKQIVVFATQGIFDSTQDLDQAIVNALDAYPDPAAPGTRNGTQVTSASLVSENILDLQGNRIINVGAPQSLMDSANKAYVDAISPGAGLSKNLEGPTFNVNLDNTLYANSMNQIGISSTGVSTGLTGGNGVPISVVPDQSQVTTVGTLTSLSVDGPVVFNNSITSTYTQDSIDQTTGAFVTTGGIGVGKSIFASGGLSIQGDANVGGTIHALTGIDVHGNKIANVADPTSLYDAANMAYVNGVAQGLSIKKSVTAASISSMDLTGITDGSVLDGVTLAAGDRILLKDQTNPVQNGIYDVVAGAPPARSADMATGSKASGTFVFVESGTMNAANGWVNISSSASDVVDTDPLNFSQFSSAGRIIAGYGLSKSGGNILSVNVDGVSLEIFDNSLRIASGAIATGLSGGSGSPIGVNASLPHVTTVGTLTRINSSGIVTVTDTTASTSPTTGSVQTLGGLGVAGSVNVGANLSVSGSATFYASVIVPSPVSGNQVANRSYVDALLATAGTGLTKTGNVLSVNASQTQVTTVGTLTGLTVAGIVNITNTTLSTSYNTGALQVAGGLGVAGSAFVNGDVAVTGNSSFVGTVTVPTPTATNHAVTKAYTDALDYLTAGQGLTRTGTVLSVNPTQDQITSVGPLTGLVSNGVIHVANGTSSTSSTNGALIVDGGIGVSGTSVFAGTVTLQLAPTNPTDAVNKSYTDSLTYLTAGAGLTRTGSTVSVNANQSQITSLGLLTGLTSSGVVTISNTSQSTSPSTGAFILSGGAGISGSIYAGSELHVAGPSMFGGTMTVPLPQNPTDVGRKDYIDGLTYLVAGTGLTKSGSSLAVNAAQPGIISVGTLTGLNSSGVVSITNTSTATNATSGALVVSGGIGIAGASYFGGNGNFLSDVYIGRTTYYTSSNLYTTALTSSTTTSNMFRLRNADASNTGIEISLANTSAATNYLSRLTLYTLNADETSANTERLLIDATETGGSIYWSNAGTGVARPLTVYGNTVFNTSGTVNINSTVDASSVTTGALSIAGGLSMAKSLFVGSNLYLNTSNLYLYTDTVAGYGVRIRNTDATNTETRLSLSNTAATGTYNSRFRLFAYGYNDAANQEYINLSATPSGAVLNWTTVGTGVARSLSIYNGAIGISGDTTAVTVGAGSTLTVDSTTDASSAASAAMVVNGGLGVGKNIYSSGNLYVPSGAITLNVVTITTDYAAKTTDYYIACNTSGGVPLAVTLPSSTNNSKKGFEIAKVTNDNTTISVTVSPGDSIAGQSTFIMNWPYASLHVVCVGTTWTIVRYNAGIVPTIWAPSSIPIDGTVTISSNTVLTRNMYYANLTVNAGVSLNTAGWRVIVCNTLTLNGIIEMNGVDASTSTGGSQNITSLTTYLGNGTDGASGRNNNGHGNSAPSSIYYNAGGAGGNGGAAGAANVGGAGGSVTPVAEVDGGPHIVATMPTLYTGRLMTVMDKISGTQTNNGTAWLQGGSGGGSGGCQTTSGMTTYSGGGGGGGGVCIVAAQSITGSGSVQANGGKGANATATGTPINPIGGGGGGGGGMAVLLYQSAIQSTISVSATGGSGGTGLAGGGNGTAGATGFAYMLTVN